MITVDEFMTTEPYTLCESDSLYDAMKVMTEKHIRHIPVTDGKKHLLGLVTQRDVLAATNLDPRQPGTNVMATGDVDIRLSDIMIKDVSIIHKTASLREAALYIQSHKYGCLPVVSDGCLVGIITDSDFIAIAINLLEQVEVADAEAEIEPENEIDEVGPLAFEETQ